MQSMEECDECCHVLETMKDPAAEPVDVKNCKEIDFLKKTRKKQKRLSWEVFWLQPLS
ncbi:MAG: hypothetical protein ACI4DV_04380 [Lachnospiraceae bacterium]